MKSFNFKHLLPHLIAIGVFLLVAVIFCKPALDSSVGLRQGDMINVRGMNHQSILYKEQHGHFPLWATSMFSGMPAFQIAVEGHWSPLAIVDKTIQFWLPEPMNFFFLACICFYFLCICMGLSPFAGVLGALGFAYATYSPIIISAGHNTKMLAMAYAPAVLAGMVLLFDKKYMWGFIVLCLATALQVLQSHQQITYYLFFIMIFMTAAYLIKSIKAGEIAHAMKSVSLMLLAGIIGVAVSAISLLTIYDFSKASKRGGQLVLNKPAAAKDRVEDGKTKGLSKDYAFQWSYGKEETWTLMIPGAMGYGTHVAKNAEDQFLFPKLSENSNTARFFEEDLRVPGDQAANYAYQQSTAMYWGDQPFTDGPVYLGAVICLLFIISMFVLKSDHKWWILGISILSVMLAWGDHFPGFNYWVFDHVPLYNKFRTPTMILIIPQMLWALMGAMLIHQLTSQPIEAADKKNFQRGLIAAAVLMGLGYFTYVSNDYSKENKFRTKEFNALYTKNDPDVQNKLTSDDGRFEAKVDNQLYEGIAMSLKGSPDAIEKSRSLVSAIREDRKELFKDSMIRSFAFMLIAGLVLFFFMQQKINARLMMGAIIVLVAIDLLTLDGNYLNKYNFDSKEDFENAEFPMNEADKTILADNDPNFRVFNVITRGSDEARTSYYHKTIGGYHPAKLAIYDDLLSYQINRGNMSVLNMLNAKYFIQQMDNNPPVALRNPDALGNAWLVKGTKTVNGPAEEMLALNAFNPRDTAIIDKSFSKDIAGLGSIDSTDMIRMTRFDNDTIHYQSNTKGNRLAVFSEIYYKDWQAYIDGKPAPIIKANYVLRALMVPAGNHEIIFRFEPKIFFLGKSISNIASWLVFMLLIGGIVWEFMKKRKEA